MVPNAPPFTCIVSVSVTVLSRSRESKCRFGWTQVRMLETTIVTCEVSFSTDSDTEDNHASTHFGISASNVAVSCGSAVRLRARLTALHRRSDVSALPDLLRVW